MKKTISLTLNITDVKNVKETKNQKMGLFATKKSMIVEIMMNYQENVFPVLKTTLSTTEYVQPVPKEVTLLRESLVLLTTVKNTT